jgi:hypothetical protein
VAVLDGVDLVDWVGLSVGVGLKLSVFVVAAFDRSSFDRFSAVVGVRELLLDRVGVAVERCVDWRFRVVAPFGVTVGGGESVAGTATSRSSSPLGMPESLIAEPPNRAAPATAALTTTAAHADAIRSPLLVTLPSSSTTTPEQITI